nr:hypothetical protein [Tanacetum cinerariifolium]
TTLIPAEIPTVSPIIPPSPDYTPASHDYSPSSDTDTDPSEDPSSDHIPPLPAASPFLSSTDDYSDSDTPDTPPSPTYGTPFTDITLSSQSSPAASGALHRRVMILAPGQPIPHGRSLCFVLEIFSDVTPPDAKLDGTLFGDHIPPLPTTSSFLSSTNNSSDNDIPDTPPSPTQDALFDSASSRSSSDHSLPAPTLGMRPSHYLCSLVLSIPRSFAAISARPSHDSSYVSPSRKRSRSHAASIKLSLPILGALSYALAYNLPSPKRIRSSEIAIYLEVSSEDRFEPYVPIGTNLEMDVDVLRSDMIEIDPEIRAEIDKCITYANVLRDRGIDAKVVVDAVDKDEFGTDVRGPIEVRVDRVTYPVTADDIPEPAQYEGAIEVTYKTLGDLVQRFHDHTVEIPVHHV